VASLLEGGERGAPRPRAAGCKTAAALNAEWAATHGVAAMDVDGGEDAKPAVAVVPGKGKAAGGRRVVDDESD
jgi:hypothetical protein